MSAIITAVFKATIGWIVDNGRDKAAEKLKNGDVTDQQFCGIIMREIDAMKSKLDGLSRKDLLASISFSKEGIELLYEAFDYTKSRSEYGADTVQAACAETVCRVNRVVYDVTQTIYNRGMLLLELPSVDAGEERVDLLRDGRVGEALRKQGTEHLSVSWIHGQDGEVQHRINQPRDIATNPSGQYIIADDDLTIKVFDKSGKFLQRFRLPALIDDHGTELLIESWSVRLATDINNNIYVLVRDTRRVRSCWIFKFDRTADQHHTFRVRKMGFDCYLCKLLLVIIF